MKVTLVLGAGASFADHIHKGYRSNWPPLDRNFFWYYREEHEDDGRISYLRLFYKLDDYFKKYYGHVVCQKDNPHNSLEYVLRILYIDTHVPYGSNEAEDLLLGLIEYLNKVIARSTNCIALNRRSKLVKLIDFVLKFSEGNLCIISFNYDLQAEKSLMVLSNNTGYKDLLSFPNCYCIPSAFYKFSKPKEKEADMFVISNQKCPIKILKPHGSLNWWKVMPKGKSISNYYNSGSDRFFISKRYLLPLDLTHKGNKTIPLLVPPLINKSVILKNNIMQNIWAEMSKEVKTSDKLIVFGYSMSDYDGEANSLFLHSLKDGSNVKAIDVINPDVNVSQKFFNISNAKVGSVFRDVKSYISHYSLGT